MKYYTHTCSYISCSLHSEVGGNWQGLNILPRDHLIIILYILFCTRYLYRISTLSTLSSCHIGRLVTTIKTIFNINNHYYMLVI